MLFSSHLADPRDTWTSRCGNAGNWKCGSGPVYSYPWRDYAPGIFDLPRPQPYRCPDGFSWNQRQQECIPGTLSGLGDMPCPQYFRYDPLADQCLPAGPDPVGTGLNTDTHGCPTGWSWSDNHQECMPMAATIPPAHMEPPGPPVVVATARPASNWKSMALLAGGGLALFGLITLVK